MSNLTDAQKWSIVNAFIKAAKKRGETYFIKQSLPQMGVWTSKGFISVDYLVNFLKMRQVLK